MTRIMCQAIEGRHYMGCLNCPGAMFTRSSRDEVKTLTFAFLEEDLQSLAAGARKIFMASRLRSWITDEMFYFEIPRSTAQQLKIDISFRRNIVNRG